jgi:hypothetical protein
MAFMNSDDIGTVHELRTGRDDATGLQTAIQS